MLYHPELIVYLWLLPVSVLIIIPALFKTGCMLYRQTSWGKAALKNDAVQYFIQTSKRGKHPRVRAGVACAH